MASDPTDARAQEPTGGVAPAAGTAEPDWTDQVSDLIVDSVDKVRSRTTGPVLNVAHASVYGVVAAMVMVPVGVVLAIASIRFLDWAIPGDVWITYLVLAVVLWIAGLVCWSRRNSGGVASG